MLSETGHDSSMTPPPPPSPKKIPSPQILRQNEHMIGVSFMNCNPLLFRCFGTEKFWKHERDQDEFEQAAASVNPELKFR